MISLRRLSKHHKSAKLPLHHRVVIKVRVVRVVRVVRMVRVVEVVRLVWAERVV